MGLFDKFDKIIPKKEEDIVSEVEAAMEAGDEAVEEAVEAVELDETVVDETVEESVEEAAEDKEDILKAIDGDDEEDEEEYIEDSDCDDSSMSEETQIITADSETHILSRDKDSLTWSRDKLIYKKKNKETEFPLDGTVIIEYVGEKKGFLGGKREIAIWTIKKGWRDKKESYTLVNSTYKKKVSLGFSKKEADTYNTFFSMITSDLAGKIVPFESTMDLDPLQIDEKHRIIKDDDKQFLRFEDMSDLVILEDGEPIYGGTAGEKIPGAVRMSGISATAEAPARGRTDDVVNDMEVRIYIKGQDTLHRSYYVLNKKSQRGAKEYRMALGAAMQIYATLYNIIRG